MFVARQAAENSPSLRGDANTQQKRFLTSARSLRIGISCLASLGTSGSSTPLTLGPGPALGQGHWVNRQLHVMRPSRVCPESFYKSKQTKTPQVELCVQCCEW